MRLALTFPMLVLIVATFTFPGDPAAEALKKHVRGFLIQSCHIAVATLKYVFWRLNIIPLHDMN